MGNEKSPENTEKSPQDNSVIQTDKTFYIAGETITGKIYLNLSKDFPGHILYLKIKGNELCEWTETKTFQQRDCHGKWKAKRYDYYHSGKKIFFEHKTPIFTWNFIQAGQYCFPFTFLLDSHLPGSFFYETYNTKAQIKQKLIAELEPATQNIKKLKSKQELVLREPLKFETGTMSQEHTAKLTDCCFDEGFSKIKCQFDQYAQMPGQMALICTEVDNTRSKLDITSIKATCNRSIILQDQYGIENNFYESISSVQVGGVKAGEIAYGEKRKITALPLIHQKSGTPALPLPSTHGHLIKCEYFLETKAEIGDVCCCEIPTITVPITFYVIPLPIQVIQPPENWAPVIYNQKIITWTEENKYTSKSQKK